MTDLENGYAIVEGVYGNLIIYKDDKPFIPTNLEPMDETDEAWEKIGEIVDALNDDREAARAQGRIEGLQEAAQPLVEAAEYAKILLRQVAEVSSLAARRDCHKRADEIDAALKAYRARIQEMKEPK